LVNQATEQRRKADDLARQAEARSMAEWALSQVAVVDKRHPAVRDVQQNVVTFQQAAEACIESRRDTWRRDQWTPSFALHVYKRIGEVPGGLDHHRPRSQRSGTAVAVTGRDSKESAEPG
jgi:hypothetical protein